MRVYVLSMLGLNLANTSCLTKDVISDRYVRELLVIFAVFDGSSCEMTRSNETTQNCDLVQAAADMIQ